MVWGRILGLLAIAAAFAGCEPKPDTFRVFGLDWIAAQQARAQRKDAALETASLARLSQDLSLDLDFEYEKASSSAKWMAVAAALAWAGDDDGAAHAAFRSGFTELPTLQGLATIALVQAGAGRPDAARRTVADLLSVGRSEDGKESTVALALAALAEADLGDVPRARELAAEAVRTQRDPTGFALAAADRAQRGDFTTALLLASEIPEGERPDDETVALDPVMAAEGPAAALILVFPAFTDDAPEFSVRSRAFLRIGWLQAVAGDADGAVATANRLGDGAVRAEALAIFALELAIAGHPGAGTAIATARRAADQAAANPFTAALLRAAAGDMDGAIGAPMDLKLKGRLMSQIALAQARSGRMAAAIATAAHLKLPGDFDRRSYLLAALATVQGRSKTDFGALAASTAALGAEQAWSRWAVTAAESTALAGDRAFEAAIERATGIAGRDSRNAALRMAARGLGAAGAIGRARGALRALTGGNPNAGPFYFAWDGLFALADVGDVAGAIAAARQAGESWGNQSFLWRVAVERGRVGDVAGARLAAEAYTAAFPASDAQQGNDRPALVEAAAGDGAAAVEQLQRYHAMPSDDVVAARIRAGGPTTVDDVVALASYADGAADVILQRAEILCRLANRLAELGAPDRARPFAMKAVAVAREAPDMPAWELACVAEAVALVGDRQDGAELLTRAETVAERAHEHASAARPIAVALAALDRVTEALSRIQALAPGPERNNSLLQVAIVQGARGQLDAALATLDGIEDPEARALALGELAQRRAFADPIGVRRAVARAAAAAELVHDPEARIYQLQQTAIVAIEIRDPDTAKAIAQRALESAAAVSLPPLRAFCLGEAADTLAAAGSIEPARQAVELGRAAAAATTAPYYRAIALSLLAVAEARSGDRLTAQRLADMAHSAALSIPD